jgi:hypothetical protein
MMKAKIKKDAHSIFAHRVNMMIRPDAPWPKTYSDFYDTLKKLSGKTLEVTKTYDKRIVLGYKRPKIIDGMKVVGIDMDRDLVKIKGKKLKKVI